MSSCRDRKYKYRNKSIILRRPKGDKPIYFENISDANNEINDVPAIIADILNHWNRKRLGSQIYLPNDIMSIISRYYVYDLILDRNESLELMNKNVCYFKNIYLHRGAILIAERLYCIGDIIIEKQAIIRSKRDSKNMSITCKGNLFNRGWISTRHRPNGPIYSSSPFLRRQKESDSTEANAGNLRLNVDGVIDSYSGAATDVKYASSGFMIRGSRYSEVIRHGVSSIHSWVEYLNGVGKDGKCIINDCDVSSEELFSQYVVADKYPQTP